MSDIAYGVPVAIRKLEIRLREMTARNNKITFVTQCAVTRQKFEREVDKPVDIECAKINLQIEQMRNDLKLSTETLAVTLQKLLQHLSQQRAATLEQQSVLCVVNAMPGVRDTYAQALRNELPDDDNDMSWRVKTAVHWATEVTEAARKERDRLIALVEKQQQEREARKMTVTAGEGSQVTNDIAQLLSVFSSLSPADRVCAVEKLKSHLDGALSTD